MSYATKEEAISDLKLDRRHKWWVFEGQLIRDGKYTHPCSGCSCDCSDGYGCNHGNSGCHECGYTGKRIGHYPIPAMDKEGNFVTIKP